MGGLEPALATATVNTIGVSEQTHTFLQYLNAVNVTTRESKVDDFAHFALTVCGFKKHDSLIHERHWISLWICGEEKSAEANVCMVDPDTKMIQVIKENKAARNIQSPEPQVIAEAISAFQHNNHIRQSMGLPALVQMTLPCITLVGTHPAFYLIPVTNMLSNAVLNGTYPLSRTRVQRCRCEVVGVNGGMENPACRTHALQHYVAFRVLAKSYWEMFSV